MWYKNALRRNLVDMHIEDWDDVFLSKFNPEEYFRLLSKGQIQAPMLYFQSHVGLCYWPTKSGAIHKAFIGKEDNMKRLEELCHKAGMDVIGYYSLIYNNWAHNRFPHWRMVRADGKHSRSYGSRYGLCCPNNLEYRKFTEEQINEFCEYFKFEGLFMDMLFWPMICYCDSCKKRWSNEVGGAMPITIDWQNKNWLTFQQKRTEWMGDYANWVTKTVKKYAPGVSIEHQYSTITHSWIRGVNENIAKASTYVGGDFYGGFNEASFVCKAYLGITEDQPFEYMTSRCYPELAEHTTTKSIDHLILSAMLTYIHHGAFLIIDAINPDGTLEESTYTKLGPIFEETKKLEPWIKSGEQVYDVALYFDLNGKYNPDAEIVSTVDERLADTSVPMIDALLGAAGSLQSHHIPYAVVNNYKFERFKSSKLLAICDVPSFEKTKVKDVLDFVNSGGNLYLSGHSSPELLMEIFGLEYCGQTIEDITYISPTDAGAFLMDDYYSKTHPLVIFGSQAKTKGTTNGIVFGTSTLPYTIPNKKSSTVWPFKAIEPEKRPDVLKFSSIHSNPPGKFSDNPALVYAKYGKGKAIWSASPIEKPKREQHSEIFARIVKFLCGNSFSFSSNAEQSVECVLFDSKINRVMTLGLINLQENFHTQPVYNFTVKIKCNTQPNDVILLPSEERMEYSWNGNEVEILIDKLHHYLMIGIKY